MCTILQVHGVMSQQSGRDPFCFSRLQTLLLFRLLFHFTSSFAAVIIIFPLEVAAQRHINMGGNQLLSQSTYKLHRVFVCGRNTPSVLSGQHSPVSCRCMMDTDPLCFTLCLEIIKMSILPLTSFPYSCNFSPMKNHTHVNKSNIRHNMQNTEDMKSLLLQSDFSLCSQVSTRHGSLNLTFEPCCQLCEIITTLASCCRAAAVDSGISEPEATTWTPSTSCMLGHFLSFGVVAVQSSNYLSTCVSGFGFFFFFLNQRKCI